MALIAKGLIANKSVEFRVMTDEATTNYLIQRWQDPLTDIWL